MSGARGRRWGQLQFGGAALLVLWVGVAALTAARAGAETVQRGAVRVTFAAELNPQRLPRHGAAPVAVTLGGRVSTHSGSTPPQLRGVTIAINRAGRLDGRGLPACTYDDVQPTTTAAAMRACGAAKVGEGSFTANVSLPEQSPFPSQGRIVAFNGVEAGQPVILAHVYGTEPVPLSYTLVLRISRSRGPFGTVLRAALPKVTANVAYVTGISLTLGRRYRSGGRVHGYLVAGCPAPAGFPGASFPLARATFAFAGGRKLSSTLTRSCRARG